jgi:glycosyltransferase involved in cell wall biosynthesis
MPAKLRLTFLIDNMGSGGSQRQMFYLLSGLSETNLYDITLVTYFPYAEQFYRPSLEDLPIRWIELSAHSKQDQVRDVIKTLRREKPDVVVSYLTNANMLACLGRLIGLRYKLIISDRGTAPKQLNRSSRLRYFLYRWSDSFVLNHEHSTHSIKSHSPKLTNKLKVIWNMVDFDLFSVKHANKEQNQSVVKVLVAASYQRLKNTSLTIEAIKLLRDEHSINNVELHWYGDKLESRLKSKYYRECVEMVEKFDLQDRVFLNGPDPNIPQLLAESHVACLPSQHEGCPNFVCEAMACGLPVVASDVGNNHYLIDGDHGGRTLKTTMQKIYPR